MLGRAMFTTVESSTTMKNPMQATGTASERRSAAPARTDRSRPRARSAFTVCLFPPQTESR
jgi:hypothetical protein